MTPRKRFGALHIVLFALALLAQIMMPAAMTRASGSSADSAIHTVICGVDGVIDGDTSPAPLHASAHDQCALCQSGSAHMALADAISTFALIAYPSQQKPSAPPVERHVPVASWPNLQAPPCGPPTLA